MPEDSKRCAECGEVKQLHDGFRRHGKTRDGFEYRCITCREGEMRSPDLAEKRSRHAAKMRRWRAENPEAASASYRRKMQRIKEDPERLARYREQQRRRDRSEYLARPGNREKFARSTRNSWLRKRYGIEPEDYERLLAEQDGVCAICGNGPDGRRKYLAVDHCHETGAIRGLLCGTCNQALGVFGDTLQGLQRAISYLSRVAA